MRARCGRMNRLYESGLRAAVPPVLAPPGGPPMPSNRRSRLITQGVARSPNRAMLRAVGFGDADFEKPIVGVANGHSTMNPCNAGIQPLVDRALAALRDDGAMP